ncbi:MAG: MDR family MFS transporter [Chloroflexota bacterium]|jgi:EmrB/QacA subfamily drug resistance transporter
MASLALILLAASLDSTAVSTALPRIVTDLASNDLYTWIFTVYLLTMTASMPIFGSISDRVGRKPVLFTGVLLFVAGSILCGLASEMWQLILFRGIQGLGAGAIVPVTLAVIGDLYPPAERARVQALFGSLFVLAFLIGPTLGGVFTDTIGWRWVFYINLPISLIAIFVVWRFMPTLRYDGLRKRFDIAGVALFVAAVVPFLIGVRNLPDGQLTDLAVGGLMLLGLGVGLVFLKVEAGAEDPIVPVRLFRDRTFATASAVVFLAVAGLFVGVVFMPRYFQLVHGASATESGWQIMTLLFGLIAGAIAGGIIVSRTGRWKILILAAMVVGIAGMVLLTGLDADSELPFVWAAMFLTGLGLGPITSILTAVVQSTSPPETMGVATSALTTFRQLGASIWLAIGGSYFTSVFDERLPGELRSAGVPEELAAGLTGSSGAIGPDESTVIGDLSVVVLAAVPAEARAMVEPYVGSIVDGIHGAVSVATGNVFWIGIVAVVAALTVLLPLREVPLPKRARASTDADEAGGEAANVALRPGLVETEPADG